jgi:hypothetical protein
MLPMVQVALATEHEGVFERLVDALRSVDAEIVRAFESTTPALAERSIDEYTIIVAGLTAEAVTLVCAGFVNRLRLARVEVDGEVIEGPRVIT